MKKDIDLYVSSCKICQQKKIFKKLTKDPLKSIIIRIFFIMVYQRYRFLMFIGQSTLHIIRDVSRTWQLDEICYKLLYCGLLPGSIGFKRISMITGINACLSESYAS